MDANGAAAQLDAVDDDVVVLAADLFRVALEQRDVLGHRRGERMMTGIPAVLFVVEPEERKFNHPQEIEAVGGNGELALGLEHVGAVKSDFSEDFAGGQPLVGGKQNQVAFFDLELLGERRFFGGAEELHDGRLPFAALDFDVGQAAARQNSSRIRSSFRSGPGWRWPGRGH